MLATLMTAVVAMGAVATTAAPQWESDYGKALKTVRADDRPLLVVLDKPGQESQQVDAESLTGAGELLAKYDLCRVNVETEYGAKVAKAFEATTFPHLAIIDKAGKVVLHSHRGVIKQDTLKSTLAKYQSGVRLQRHTVMKPATTSFYSSPVYYNNSYCPSCQKGY